MGHLSLRVIVLTEDEEGDANVDPLPTPSAQRAVNQTLDLKMM